jgi:putative nucleotidyltransferase with HDIG domain
VGASGHSSEPGGRPAIALPDRVANGEAGPRAALGRVIPRRPRVSFAFGIVLALAFALVVTTAVTAERWLTTLGIAEVTKGEPAPITVRVAPFAGKETHDAHIGGGGVVIARGEVAERDDAGVARDVRDATPTGPAPYAAFAVLAFVFAAIFSHHMRRSTKGRLLRVQIVSLVTVAFLAVVVKVLMLTTAISILVVPIALLAMVPTMVLDRVVGIATGTLAALVTALLIPFDVSVAILLLVQAATAGLVVAEHPRSRWRAAVSAGAVTTLFTVGTVVLLTYMTSGTVPTLDDPWRSPLVAAAIGPILATLFAVPLTPIYQLLVGEITQGRLVELEDLSNPLLRQIAEKSPGTWQHSLMMANMAEIAANAIGASGRLVRVGAYYHDLGKSLQAKYFIENLEPGETSPHDQLPPEVSCDAIFAHVTEGIVAARRAGLHERIVDFMHMHHGNGVLEYFWGRCQEQGNPKAFTIDNFRYPGHPPQSRETAILAICDAVEAASRTLKKPDTKSIDALVQRIVYGKLHLGQLDESGLSMSDLRRISDSLKETIRHANHGRIEYPWQKAQQDASATREALTQTSPRLDSLDRVPRRDTTTRPAVDIEVSPATSMSDPIPLDRPSRPSNPNQSPEAFVETANYPRTAEEDIAILETAPIDAPPRTPHIGHDEITRPAPLQEPLPEDVKIAFRRTGTHSSMPPRPRTESERSVVERIPRPRTESERIGMPKIDLPPDRISASEMLGDAPPRRPRARTESDGVLDAATRTRAATIPPVAHNRPPTISPASSFVGLPAMPPGASLGSTVNAQGEVELPPVPEPSPSRSLPAVSPMLDQPPDRRSGPPLRTDLESAITNPPPMRRTMKPPLATRLPAFISQGDDMDAAVTGERMPIVQMSPFDDAGSTEPSLPAATIPEPAASQTLSGDPLRRAVDLASRADASERDEWSVETPVVAPSKAALRALLGVPDVTRQQSVEEIERLHEAVREYDSDPAILPPPAILDAPSGRIRTPRNTAEVEEDAIESSIELAPPARKTAIGIMKKPPPK